MTIRTTSSDFVGVSASSAEAGAREPSATSPASARRRRVRRMRIPRGLLGPGGGLLAVEDDDSRAGQIDEINAVAIVGDGERDILAAARQRHIANDANVVALVVEVLDEPLGLGGKDLALARADVHRVAAAAEA